MLLSFPSRLLAATGRQGTRAVAASIFLGLAVPPLAAAAKPLLMPCVFTLLVMSFMRTDLARLRKARELRVILPALAWIMGVLPMVFGFMVNRILPPSDSGVMLAMVLQAAGPPLMSTPAVAILIGVDATLSLAVMLLSLIIVPFTAPVMVSAFTDGALALDGLALAGRLAFILIATAGAGLLLRAMMGPRRLAVYNDHFNGVNVLVLLVLAVAFMDGVTLRFLEAPALVAGIAALACLVSVCGLLSTVFVFRWAGAGQDVMLGYAAGNRNLGIMIAAAGGIMPESTWLYVALAQFPIYLMPALLRPLMARLARNRTP